VPQSRSVFSCTKPKHVYTLFCLFVVQDTSCGSIVILELVVSNFIISYIYRFQAFTSST
jgi:hypothetical protein